MFGAVSIRLLCALTTFAYAAHGAALPENARRGPGSARSSWSITAPSRPLEWGDLNVIHTTDTHGWLLGHQEPSVPEPNYSGTYGDFASFVSHMKKLAVKKNVDLLVVDTGDVHDGTGLSDGFPPSGEGAHDFKQFIKQVPYDLLTIGNHELYVYNNTLNMHTDFAPRWNGRYLTSNVNITVPDPADASKTGSVPVGSRYAKFKTRLGRRVTSLGVIYDFTGNDEGTTVQKMADMVKEQWFAEAIAEEPDLFLIPGHMPARYETWPTLFNAIRAVHPTTPILMFGGHEHIRDCLQFDGRSMTLASGRYMETIGWMSVKFDKKKSAAGNLTISRRYLDTNRLTYQFHTGRNNRTFDTPSGLSITRGLEELAQRFDLNLTYGVAPRDLSLTRDQYPGNGSLLSVYIEQAFPVATTVNNTRNSSSLPPAIFITNTGSQRFDIFQGPFTKNDQLTASPFRNEINFISNVSYDVAKQVLGLLNEVGGEVTKRELTGMKKKRGRFVDELYKRGDTEIKYREWLADMYARELARAREYGYDLERRGEDANTLTMGYVTSDSCPGIGDDTPHTPPPFFSTPAYISSSDSSPGTPPSGVTSDSDPVDLVFVSFVASDVLTVLNELQSEVVYTESDVGLYSELVTNEVWGVYAQEAWN